MKIIKINFLVVLFCILGSSNLSVAATYQSCKNQGQCWSNNCPSPTFGPNCCIDNVCTCNSTSDCQPGYACISSKCSICSSTAQCAYTSWNETQINGTCKDGWCYPPGDSSNNYLDVCTDCNISFKLVIEGLTTVLGSILTCTCPKSDGGTKTSDVDFANYVGVYSCNYVKVNTDGSLSCVE